VYAAIIVFAGSFLPNVLSATLGLSPADGGSAAAIVPAAAFFGMFAFAYLVHRSGRPAVFGRLTSVVQLLAWAAFAALWFVGALNTATALILLAVFGFCYQACFGLGLHRIENSAGVGADTVGVAAGFYFTGVSIGGYVLPTILAHIVDATSAKAGFIGLGVLFVVGAALWLFTRARDGVGQQPAVPEFTASQGALRPGRAGSCPASRIDNARECDWYSRALSVIVKRGSPGAHLSGPASIKAPHLVGASQDQQIRSNSSYPCISAAQRRHSRSI
jgi:MFS family permease